MVNNHRFSVLKAAELGESATGNPLFAKASYDSKSYPWHVVMITMDSLLCLVFARPTISIVNYLFMTIPSLFAKASIWLQANRKFQQYDINNDGETRR